MIVLDFGSGNTCKNDKKIIKKMIDELSKVDKQRKCIIKWQLFKKCGKNIPLTKECFSYAYQYAKKLGFKTTASVFDKESLEYLLKYEIPFVKIACRYDLYWLIYEVPRKIPVIYSWSIETPGSFMFSTSFLYNVTGLLCVRKYPASINDYGDLPIINISDHTIGWELYKSRLTWVTNELNIYECHYALEGATGLDAECGICRTPEMLKEIL